MDPMDADVHRYQKQILRRDNLQYRGYGIGPPPAWAPSRSDLAETTNWFKQYQGGTYTLHGAFEGLLIGKYTVMRSYMDAEVLITSIIGERSAYEAANTQSQSRNRIASTVLAFKTSIQTKKLIGLIVQREAANTNSGARQKRKDYVEKPCLFPVRMRVGYESQVVDWFVPVDIWPEKRLLQDSKGKGPELEGIIWMVKLEKLNLQKQSYWANPNIPVALLSERNPYVMPPSRKCDKCSETSPQIFSEGWMCRNESCAGFWTLNGRPASRLDLNYSERFLMQRSDHDEFPSKEFHPDFIEWWQNNYEVLTDQTVDQENYKDVCRRLLTGFCCPRCGMLNRRHRWSSWTCDNPNCDFTRRGHPTGLDLERVRLFGKLPDVDFEKLAYYTETTNSDAFKIYHYKFMDDCRVSYMMPKPGHKASEGLASRYYEMMMRLANSGEIDLQRRVTQSAAQRMMTKHFSENFGRKYYFASETSTRSFEESPSEIYESVKWANRTCRDFFPDPTENFNELYVVGYWTSMKMNWHDDGQHGLGPVIATWTLGGDGRMRFGVKSHLYSGVKGGAARMPTKWKPKGLSQRTGHESESSLPSDLSDDEADDEGPVTSKPRTKASEKSRTIKGTRSKPTKTVGQNDADERSKIEKRGKRFLDKDPVPSGCAKFEERKALKERLEAGLDQESWQREFNKLMADVPPTKEPKEILQFPLRHGSVVVMHGANMQKYYEHCIEVDSPFRFALTYRHIGDDHEGMADQMDTKKRMKKEKAKGKGKRPQKGEKKRKLEDVNDDDGDDEVPLPRPLYDVKNEDIAAMETDYTAEEEDAGLVPPAKKIKRGQ